MSKQSELDELLYQFSNYWRGNDLDTLLKLSPERAKQAILDWHNKQVGYIIEATYNNLPSLDKLTVGNEMSDGYDQGVEAFRQAMIKALYGKETN